MCHPLRPPFRDAGSVASKERKRGKHNKEKFVGEREREKLVSPSFFVAGKAFSLHIEKKRQKENL